MEKEMIELFIYYIMALEEEGTTDYSINGCVRAIENAISCIENEGIEKWNNLLEKFPENHPLLKKQGNLKKLPEEEYKKMLEKVKKLMRFYSKSGTLNYDSLYLLESEKDVERLAYQIILRNKHTSEIKELLEKLIVKKSTLPPVRYFLLTNCKLLQFTIRQEFIEKSLLSINSKNIIM